MKAKRSTATGGAEMVEIQETRILRPAGGRDRHGKIYTTKGPRDRRVRLSAHTAIQFYDVQDRLGYDRPSKAVDWLFTKAKSSIDKLSELQPLDLESMKAFFPASSAETFVDFQTCPSSLISQTVDSCKDLDLSLQTVKNAGLVLAEHSSESEGNLFPDSSPAGFEAFCGRMVDWNSNRSTPHGGGFCFPSPSMTQPPSLGQGSPAFPPGEVLQPPAWNDITAPE